MNKFKGKTAKTPLSENETRTKLLTLAKQLGCEKDLIQIIERYDKLLKNCSNQIERQQISVLGNVEIHKLFNFRNPLVLNGVEVIPGEQGWDDIDKGL